MRTPGYSFDYVMEKKNLEVGGKYGLSWYTKKNKNVQVAN